MYIKYEKGEKFAKAGAPISEDLNAFDDAGYILKDTEVVVDIDNLPKDKIKAMLDYFGIQTQTVWTDRGAHLYFKKPTGFRSNEGICALGFKVEFKRAKGSTLQSVTIKRNGVARPIEHKGEREELPSVLKAMRGVKEGIDAFGDGDGRNNALFRWRKVVSKRNDWQRILSFINEKLFDEPLPEKEFDSICRDAIEAGDEATEESIIATQIIHERKAVLFAEEVYLFDGEKWLSERNLVNRIIYDYCVGKPTRFVDEVYKQLEYRTKYYRRGTFDIRLKNGILRKGRYYPVDSGAFSPYYIPIKYNPDAKPVQIVDEYLGHLSNHDDDYKKVLLEMIAYTLITDAEFKRTIGKFFICVGSGGNGKGTLLQVIKRILDAENCSTLSLEQLPKEQYSNNLIGKLANLGDDVEDEAIDKVKMKLLKNISTCDDMALRKLFKNSENVQLTTTLIFTSNHILKSFEKGKAYKRRVMWLPMYTKVKKADGNFISNLTSSDALEYWFKLITEAYMRLYATGAFTDSKLLDEFNEEYHRENDNTIEYCEGISKDDVEGLTIKQASDDYEMWCMENGYNPLSNKRLKEQFMNYFNLDNSKVIKVSGKSVRVFSEVNKK